MGLLASGYGMWKKILNNLIQVLKEWREWADHPLSPPHTASTGALGAWVWWRIHCEFLNLLGEEKSTHSLADKSSSHPAYQRDQQVLGVISTRLIPQCLDVFYYLKYT